MLLHTCKNREILKSLIDIVVFLGKQELAFRVHNKGNNSENKGNYLKMLEFLSEYDTGLCCYLDTVTAFVGTSSRNQNNLTQSVADMMNEAMKDEVKKAAFVSIMVDEPIVILFRCVMSCIMLLMVG